MAEDIRKSNAGDNMAHFYLMFGMQPERGATSFSDEDISELDEIEQIGRMVLEVSEDRPIFMTTT